MRAETELLAKAAKAAVNRAPVIMDPRYRRFAPNLSAKVETKRREMP
jgi:hypothetical protein